MTYIYNDPKRFARDSLAGFVQAHSRYVTAVHGGVVRATASPENEVALVIGGGSGHYPAFSGWTGPGMAHGTVCGNVFASPSESQVLSVARAADNGGGVLIVFGNYAGDVLHFGAAAKDLREDYGIDARIVTISDDIASAPPEKHRERRGIGGDLFVVKTAGAAIAAGADLDAAEKLAWHANDSVRTLGVAFSGCTLPGASEPLFTVPEGKVALGLGIHGEPGISEHDHMTATELAQLLVSRVMAEEPARVPGGYEGKVAVILNGLGATKYEELFLLYGEVTAQLAAYDVEIIAPEVGEQVTSLDMAGASLSLAFLDPELEKYWLAPADTPAFKVGQGQIGQAPRRTKPLVGTGSDAGADAESPGDVTQLPKGSAESAAQGAQAAEIFQALAQAAIDAEESLGKLDSIAGDGDHGQGMVLGSVAARDIAQAAAAAGCGARTVIDQAGRAWSEGAGGTSGALWGGAIREVARAFDDKERLAGPAVGAAVVAGARHVALQGGAKVGQKTMVDATEPFADALETALESGKDLAAAWAQAAATAQEAAQATSEIVATKGRAKTHGDASLGHPDPGAVSFALLMETAAATLAKQGAQG
ncbi:dihydroxyacetone kinase [Actinobaculum suis]|uniref:dihydroxyacetone kinase family protein n=2 Tax=Actinobaculum suis TaxID=1657 RepID=UPI00066FEE9C|nr:dihydroxyacetone kinase family protein [Actinobaculum suis]KMY22762.1 dihydroxyacetone kinase [Actinobaculum suis]